MGLNSAKSGKLLYHLTLLDNLNSIVQHGLIPRRRLREMHYPFCDIADSQILDGRETLGLDKYTPFHFHPYSAFDKAVKNTYKNACFIYICIGRDFARKHNFQILPIHPLTHADRFEILGYEDGMNAIDWDTLMQVGAVGNYAKGVKMAECLTEQILPIKAFNQLVVQDEQVKKIVESILSQNSVEYPPPYVNIQPNWFCID